MKGGDVLVKDVTNVLTAGRLTCAAIVSRKVEEQTDFHYSYSDLEGLVCTTQMILQSLPQLHYTEHREMKSVLKLPEEEELSEYNIKQNQRSASK